MASMQEVLEELGASLLMPESMLADVVPLRMELHFLWKAIIILEEASF